MNLHYDEKINKLMQGLNSKPAEKLKLAAAAINLSMTWCNTPEGEDYWRGIHNKLVENAKKLEKKADGLDETKYATVVRIAIDLTKKERMQLLDLLKAGVEGEAAKAVSAGETVAGEDVVSGAKWEPLPLDLPKGYVPVSGCTCPSCKAARKAEKGSLTIEDIKKAKKFLKGDWGIPAAYIPYDPKTGKTMKVPKLSKVKVGPATAPDIDTDLKELKIVDEVPF